MTENGAIAPEKNVIAQVKMGQLNFPGQFPSRNHYRLICATLGHRLYEIRPT